MSFLSALGGDIKKVFGWLGSSKGKSVVGAVETGIESLFPAADGAITLVNSWLAEIFKSESMASAAVATPGAATNTQKAALVLASVTPQALAFAQTYKLPAPSAATLDTVNTALVTVLNALSGKTATATTAPNTTGVAAPPTPAVAPTTGAAV